MAKEKTIMNQVQDNQTTMFETTLNYLDENTPLWIGTPAFASAVTEAKTAVSAIRATSDVQETPTKGVTQDKGSMRDQLEELTLYVGDQVAAWAATSSDLVMLAK